LRASWLSSENLWTIEAEKTDTGEKVPISANFLWMCQGYYRHSEGFTPEWPDTEKFKGRIVHPQCWPDDLAVDGKKVVVIGSGATAATLVPAIADRCAHVTMLQRSPTYFRLGRNAIELAEQLRQLQVKEEWIHEIVRRKILFEQDVFTKRCISEPDQVKKELLGQISAVVGPDYDIATHFTPTYRPWRQRIAFVPDADLFHGIKSGKASVVTDEIDRFTEDGILLKSGKALEADIIVSATGLQMLALGAVQLNVDGEAVVPGRHFIYKGTMLSNVPNFAFCIGYTNASWTLRADLASTYVCRVLNHMDRHSYRTCKPACDPSRLEARPLLNLNSGYVRRAAADLPKQAATAPWLIRQNYLRDMLTMKISRLEDGILQFGTAAAVARADVREEVRAVGD